MDYVSGKQPILEYYHLFKAMCDLKVTALFDPNTNPNTQAVIDKDKALTEIVDDYNQMFGTGKIINRNADPALKSFKSDITGRLSHKGAYKNLTKAEMLNIVIVVDQLLTGFDSKFVNTLTGRNASCFFYSRDCFPVIPVQA